MTADPTSPAGIAQYAAAQRTFWGFDASAEAIAGAAADPDATTDDLGTPLTPIETARFAGFREVAATISKVNGAGEDFGDYAGAYVDPANRNALDVVIVNDDCALLEALRHDFRGLVIQGVPAANDLDTDALFAVAGRFQNHFRQLQSEGVEISTAGVSIPQNSFTVDLLPTSAAHSREAIDNEIGKTGVRVTRKGVPQDAGSGRPRVR